MDPDSESPYSNFTRTLERWFASLSPTRIDLVGDFAGKEVFVIEGDSLLRTAFGDERIDMNDGLQVLHVVYVVERFLYNLKSRGCRFHVIFFNFHKDLCIPEHVHHGNYYKYKWARACIIQHLRRYNKGSSTGPGRACDDGNGPSSGSTLRPAELEYQVEEFNNPYSSKFEAYLKAVRPYFILTHDGIDGTPKQPGKGEGPSRITLQKGMLLEFIRYVRRRNYTIGLINEVEFQNSKVYTFIVPHNDLIFADAEPAQILPMVHELLSKEFHTTIPTLKRPLEEEYIHELISKDIKANLDASTLLHLQSLAILCQQKLIDMPPLYIESFLLHLALKRFLPLSQRRIPGKPMSGESIFEKADAFTKFLAMCQLKLLKDNVYSRSLFKATLGTDLGLADHIDGRLWKYILANHSLIIRFQTLSPEVSTYYTTLTGVLQSYSRLDMSQLSLQDDWSSGLNHTEAEQELGISASHWCSDTTVHPRSILGVLPFSNSAFNEHLACIQLAVDAGLKAQMPAPSSLEKALYETHWHSTKRIDTMHLRQGDKLMRASQKLQWWQLKGNQIARAKMLKYAMNLAGGDINPEVIIPGKLDGKTSKNLVSGAEQKPAGNQSAKSKKAKTSNATAQKAKQIRAANEQRMSLKNYTRAVTAWKTFYREFCLNCETKRGAVVALSGFIAKSKEESITVEARLFKCYLLFDIWKGEYCGSEKNKPSGYKVVALIFHEATLILSSPMLTLRIKNCLDSIFDCLGFTSLEFSPPADSSNTAMIVSPPMPSKTRDLTNTKVDGDLKLHDFQLQYCGPYMERNLFPTDDRRVKFKPDAWQVQVLDALDADKSVFVVAPTSSGKTFIAYYAIERILREDNSGVLVYVAPTKALVNQIAAEVQGRFDKNYKDSTTVWAIHTRDYRVNNPQKCQVLVTVPHILQIMLLSPPFASSWSPRVKRIILDEVHCIGEEDGVVWEQILLLAPCPIIALSATVGNPTQFHQWLQITQSSILRRNPDKDSKSEGVQGIPVELISHRHRYNDLRKFYYNHKIGGDSNFMVVDNKTIFTGIEKVSIGTHIGIPNLDDIPRFRFIHPVATLSESDGYLPHDLALESRDCYRLWSAMVRVQTASYPVPKDLQPTPSRFSAIIKKIDVIQWEEGLKSVLRAWMKDSDSPMAKLLELLRNGMDEKPEDNSEPQERLKDKISRIPRHQDTMQMLCDLHQLNALPALLFIYDRAKCNDLCASLFSALLHGEHHYKETNEAWKKKIEEKEALQKANLKKKAKIPKKKVSVTADNLTDIRDVPEASAIDSFDPNWPIQEFTFADSSKCSKEEVTEEMEWLRRAQVPAWQISALRRGIGIHHAGISRPLRECVERLFRKGYLRVVIATGTLSLGINMPCATVVFVTDSVYLTPLNYRQASGRAGRRGFDLLGNVVFHKIHMHRAFRLMNSHLPSLTGHFPTSTTLMLRLFILLYGSENSNHAIASINSLLSQNRISVGLEGISFKEQVLHHVRFSIEYLRRTKLLSASGIPINFANCVSHLYYTEPSNFMLNALLHGGVFHKICDRFSSCSLLAPESDAVQETVYKDLMLILAHFFGRKRFKKGDDLKELLEARSSSTVVLGKLPEEAAKVIRDHNQLALDIFINYVTTFAEQHCASSPDDTLPFTSAKFPPTAGSTSIILDDSVSPASARSSFVSLSGHSDNFNSLEDLLTSCRGDILLEASGIPYIPVDDDVELNAYLYDFFLHGSVTELENANNISQSDVWFLLNDFSMVLATIVTCLKNLLMYGPDGDMKAAHGEGLDEGFEGVGDALEAKRDVMAGTEEPEPESQGASSQAGTQEELEAEPKGASSQAKRDPDQSVDWDASESELSEDDIDDFDESYLGYDVGEKPEGNERERLLKVLKGFIGLQTSFNLKFKAMFATKADRNKAKKKQNLRPKIRV